LRRKIAELNQKLIDGEEELSSNKSQAIKDDIMVLKSAAKILDIDL
jgi:NAD+--asparagine ADP-ribosyltransferase